MSLVLWGGQSWPQPAFSLASPWRPERPPQAGCLPHNGAAYKVTP